ncbi:MAG: hypothetical protein FI681_02505 [SAR202 cluster bacterium]|nr:hypothetical protein [SAR202 cluster bacterium]
MHSTHNRYEIWQNINWRNYINQCQRQSNSDPERNT